MAIITKRRKAFTVVYTKIDKENRRKTVYETFYDYSQALNRKSQIEKGIKTIEVDKDTKMIDFLYQYTIIYGQELWSNSKYDIYIGIINNYLYLILQDVKIKEVRKGTAETIINKMKVLPAIGKRHQKAQEFMPKSMQYEAFIFLKKCFDYLVAENLIEQNEFHDIKVENVKSKGVKNKWDIFTFDKVVNNCQDSVVYLFLHLLFSTGLSISEVLGLSWGDLNRENENRYITSDKLLKRINLNTLELLNKQTIIQKYKNNGSTSTNTALVLLKKESNIKRIKIPSQLFDLLMEWKRLQICSTNPSSNIQDLIFTQFDGRPYDERVINKKFKNITDKLSICDVSLNSLKFYGQKLEGKRTVSVKYYQKYGDALRLPKRNPTKLYSKNKEELVYQKNKLNAYLPERKDKNLEILLDEIHKNPDLKKELIKKLISEQ